MYLNFATKCLRIHVASFISVAEPGGGSSLNLGLCMSAANTRRVRYDMASMQLISRVLISSKAQVLA